MTFIVVIEMEFRRRPGDRVERTRLLKDMALASALATAGACT